MDRVDDRLGLVARLDAVDDVVVGVVGVVRVAVVGSAVGTIGLERAVADLDRVGAAGHLDDRRAAEVRGEALGSIVAEVTMTLRSGRRGSSSRR